MNKIFFINQRMNVLFNIYLLRIADLFCFFNISIIVTRTKVRVINMFQNAHYKKPIFQEFYWKKKQEVKCFV